MNNLLKHYGAQSVYGESIPIACAGIVMKVNQLYFSIVIGLAQGSQPIESFNYGAKQYKRVTDAFLLAASVGAVVSIISFLLFQLFPRQILFLLPLIVALPHFFGIMGVLYAGPIADLLSFAVGISMVIVEFKHINKLEAELA